MDDKKVLGHCSIKDGELWVYDGTTDVRVETELSIVNIPGGNIYANQFTSTSNITEMVYDRSELKKFLLDNPDLLSELISEIRKEKN